MKRTAQEYSKWVLNRMIALWFIGAAFGAAVVVAEIVATFAGGGGYTSVVVHLPDLLMYIGAPITGGIVSYLIKSAMENKEKIKNHTKESEETNHEWNEH
jgi:fructose-specific phosphotransferase system IIC component